jgi:hypothetical protein
MQISPFKITHAAVAQDLRGAENFSDPGSHADVGLPRLQCSRHLAGNRMGREGTAPGVWGTPGADFLAALPAGAPPVPQVEPGGAGEDDGGGSLEGGDGDGVRRREDSGETEKDNGGERKVIFTPKPNPWGGARGREAKIITRAVPASFCRRSVIFTPTPNPIHGNG